MDPVTGRPIDSQPQWGAPPPPPAKPMWLQLVQRFWFIGLIVIVAGAGWYLSAKRDDSGQISNSGSLQVGDLRSGDCFNIQDEDAEEVDEVDAKRCDETHKYEMFHVVDMPGSEFPAESDMAAFVEQECFPAFASYVGLTYENSVLDFIYFTPTGDAWDDGDHSVQCAAYEPDGNDNPIDLTGSIRDAAR